MRLVDPAVPIPRTLTGKSRLLAVALVRVLYDGYIYSLQSEGGINRVFENVVRRLPADWEPRLFMPHLRDAAKFTHLRAKVRCHSPKLLWGTRVERSFMARAYPWRVCSWGADVYHPTYYQLLSGPGAQHLGKPLVITLHDFILRRFPDRTRHWADAEHWIRRQSECIRAADALICYSEHTLVDLREFHPEAVGKTRVIPAASDLSPIPGQGGGRPTDAPYFLVVGSRGPHKNFETTLKAFARLEPRKAGIRLVAAGIRGASATEQILMDELKLSDEVLFVPAPDDATIANFYAGALALLYPSRHEGFGLPVLEAMRCGTAVITSEKSSLPEVAGDAALYADPGDPESICQAMRSLVSDEAGRQELIRRGAARAAMFSWDRTASETAEVYRSLG